MMNQTTRFGFSSVPRAARNAFQWRLLVLWAAWLLIPTLVLAMPAWQMLGYAMDNSVHSAALAKELDLASITDLMYYSQNKRGDAFSVASTVAVALTLFISPLLTGLVATASRADATPGFRELMAGALREYPRMLRMMIVALIPLGIAFGLGGAIMDGVGKAVAKSVSESDAETMGRLGMLAAGLLVVLAHATVDAGRAALTIERRRSSAFKAWWDGAKMLARRPLATVGSYLLISLVGLAVAAVLLWLRINLPYMGVASFVGGIVLTLVVVMALGWMRSARLFAMVDLARSQRS
jgi:hypothetical protein